MRKPVSARVYRACAIIWRLPLVNFARERRFLGTNPQLQVQEESKIIMHGEYKMPGGKLIVADVRVAGGNLAAVQISGDFFLQPDMALEQINRALTGLPAQGTREDRVRAIENGLGDDVQMYGISAEAVAIAVERALEGES